MLKITGNDIPERLRELPQPPKVLYVKGELPEFAEYTYLTVVGSRRLSNYGREACEKIISGLTGYPIVIVSGLALGMDTVAHQAALTAGLKTIGVPGSGIDETVLYPRASRPLARQILQAGGALLGEYEPKAPTHIYMFPERNRIMVGLADAVLVIEAGEKSGTLITARLSSEYNRDLYVVPGPIFSPHCVGSNKMMKLGAMPICSSEDLLSELGFAAEKKQLALELSDKERMVADLLLEPQTRDALIRESGLAAAECNTLLMTMEIKGLIKESLGEIHWA